MFRNRSFLVKVVKDEAPKVEEIVERFEYDTLVRTISRATMALLATYMVGDTLRKVVVHVVSAKVG